MAIRKRVLRAKEPVRVRFRRLANGNLSLYLDIYSGGRRSYEFLKMYLVPETDGDSRKLNRATMNAANAVKARRIIELDSGVEGMDAPAAAPGPTLRDWLMEYHDFRVSRGKRLGRSLHEVANTLDSYGGSSVLLRDVDKAFCIGYIDYLRSGYVSPLTHRPLKSSSAHNYCVALTTALNEAARRGLIAENPMRKISADDKIRAGEGMREYLTVEEVAALIRTPVKPIHGDIKRAFLFSCCCGLRFSDVAALRWGNIETSGGHCRLVGVVIRKTRRPLYVDLSDEAVRWLPERPAAASAVGSSKCAGPHSPAVSHGSAASSGSPATASVAGSSKCAGPHCSAAPTVPCQCAATPAVSPSSVLADDAPVFQLITNSKVNPVLRDWARRAGISKWISFHTARHTFATLELTCGADLYTVSKLLGHSNVRTTEVYAKIISKKKEEAVHLLDGIFG